MTQKRNRPPLVEGSAASNTDLARQQIKRENTLKTTKYQAALCLHRLYASAWPDRSGINALQRHGVDIDLMLNMVGPVVRALATFPGDGFFDFDGMGEVAFVIPAMHEDAKRQLDIVAWSARKHDVFGFLLGTAGLLGADAILNPASFQLGPCPIWPTPLRWLQASCTGAVVLDAELARAIFEKAPAGMFLAEHEEAADELVALGLVPPSRLMVKAKKPVAA